MDARPDSRPHGARLGVWQAAVRDHPDSPPAGQCHVLDRLALRLDWTTGTGYASSAELAADAKCSRDTVTRALWWARRHELLVRTKRGHALRNGKGMASQWLLALPGASGTASHSDIPNLEGRNEDLEGRNSGLEGGSGRPPSNLSTSGSKSSGARRRSAARTVRAAYPDATDDEIEIIVRNRIGNGARSAEAVIAHEARQGTLRLPCDIDGPYGHSNACRDGDGSACAMNGCTCRCHIKPVVAL